MAARLRTAGRPAVPASGVILLALGALLLGGRPALASSVLPMTLEETVRRADAICVGRVLGHQTHWQDASRRFMVTEYLFWVEEAILLSTKFSVPANVPSGSYYLAAFIREDGGPNQNAFPLSNNTAWSRYRIGVEP